MRNLSKGFEFPSQDHSDPLQQVARQLDVANIRWVVFRIDIVVLQDPLGAEIVDESPVLEMFVDLAMLLLIDLGRSVGQAIFFPPAPLRLRKVSL